MTSRKSSLPTIAVYDELYFFEKIICQKFSHRLRQMLAAFFKQLLLDDLQMCASLIFRVQT